MINAPRCVHSETHRDTIERRAAPGPKPQAREHDAFAAHLYRSRREFRLVCERAGESGKPIERCVISTFQVAGSMGFKGDFWQWEELLRIGD